MGTEHSSGEGAPRQVDMTPAGVEKRLRQLNELYRLWITLGKSRIVDGPPVMDSMLAEESAPYGNEEPPPPGSAPTNNQPH